MIPYSTSILGVKMIQDMLNLNMVVGNGAECISCSTPLFCHLVHVGCPPIAFQCLVLLTGTPEEKRLSYKPLDLSKDMFETSTHTQHTWPIPIFGVSSSTGNGVISIIK